MGEKGCQALQDLLRVGNVHPEGIRPTMICCLKPGHANASPAWDRTGLQLLDGLEVSGLDGRSRLWRSWRIASLRVGIQRECVTHGARG